MTARRDGHLVLWSNWIAHRPLTADVAGSSPVRTARTYGKGGTEMRPIWLLDFDGVVNALSKRGGRAYWPDWRSATIPDPDGGLTRAGTPLQLQLLWAPEVIDTVRHALDAGVDVRWLSTWRAHTALLPEIIPGLPRMRWLDETILAAVDESTLDPGKSMESGPWKVLVAKAYVPGGAPLLWTEDSLSIDLLSESWRRARTAATTLIRPRGATGLIQREVRTIREWISDHT